MSRRSNVQLLIVGVVSLGLTAYAMAEFLRVTLDPVIRSLGA